MITTAQPLLFLCTLLLLLITASGTRATSSLASPWSDSTNRRTQTLALYNVPPFAVSFTLPYDSSQILSQVSKILKENIEAYLKDYFSISSIRSQTTLQGLQTVDLKINLKESKTAVSTQHQYYAELYGTMVFTDSVNRPSSTPADEFIRIFVTEALQTDFSKFKASVTRSFPSVENLSVDVNLQNFATPTASTPSSLSGWSQAEIMFLSFLIFFLLCSISLISFYIRLDQRQKRYSRPESMYDDEARDAYIGRNINDQILQRNGDPQCNGSDGNAVPVAVASDQPATRRYIATSNPFELLYGASFLHSDKPSVERKKVKSKKKRIPTSAIKPMLPITEEEQENNDSMHSTSSWEGGVAAFLFRNLPSAMPWATKPPEAVQEQSFPFAFRDFPRHDGTPCLMYNPKEGDEEQVEFGPAAPGTIISNSTQMSLIIECNMSAEQNTLANSMHSLNSTGSVDNFVDKLEALMVLKQKQYEERTKMEQERLERKRERDSKRQGSSPQPLQRAVDLLDNQIVEPAPPSPIHTVVSPENVNFSPAVSLSPGDITKMMEQDPVEGTFA